MPLGIRDEKGKGKVRARDKLRKVIESMKVEKEVMEEGD